MMAMLGSLARSKTIWFNVLTLLAVVFMSDEVKVFVSADTLVKIQAVINIGLRFLTVKPVAEK